MDYKIKGNIVDAFNREIFPAELIVENSRIRQIRRIHEELKNFILPGLIDSHVHIESSMLTPSEFSRIAVRHGTIGAIADPHEIANVSGIKGIDFMIENGKSVPFKFFYGAPSCVPATKFENSGAELDPDSIEKLMKRDDIFFLSEVMNFPGVINGDVEILKKIDHAIKSNKPIDGHAPGVIGNDLKKYIDAGISTDHETIDINEAEEKIRRGMKLLIREGSAAKGFDIFGPLIDVYPDSVMLCTDDIHPDDLIGGHINELLARGVKLGLNVFNLIKAACINPVFHYKLPVGLLREGDLADMIIVENLTDFRVVRTYINGKPVFDNGGVLFQGDKIKHATQFRNELINAEELKIKKSGNKIRVIQAVDGELVTGSVTTVPLIKNEFAVSDPDRDILKIAVVNRYKNSPAAKGFVNGFGLKEGAIACSIAHDSHNIIAVGVNDSDIAEAINTIIDMKGGLAVVLPGITKKMILEIAGLMTFEKGEEVASSYRELESFAKKLGSTLKAPFMTLSFMSLLVIPELKISDRGIFDGNVFAYTDLFTE
jgi:adenine deaminase